VATTAPTADSTALPGIHARLEQRRLLPAQHLIDGGYTSVALMDTAARTHRIEVIGPVSPDNSWQRKAGTGFPQEDFTVDFDRRQVTCPDGKTSGNWAKPPAQAPYALVAFDARHCSPCPHRSRCTCSKDPRKGRTPPRPPGPEPRRSARSAMAASLRSPLNELAKPIRCAAAATGARPKHMSSTY
jgi:hypothetical protein